MKPGEQRRVQFVQGQYVINVACWTQLPNTLKISTELRGHNAAQLTPAQVDDLTARGLIKAHIATLDELDALRDDLRGLRALNAAHQRELVRLREQIETRDAVIEAFDAVGTVRHKRIVRNAQGAAEGVIETEVTFPRTPDVPSGAEHLQS